MHLHAYKLVLFFGHKMLVAPAYAVKCIDISSVAGLTVPGGQDLYYPHFSSNFYQFSLFFLKFSSFWSSRAGESPTWESPGYATDLYNHTLCQIQVGTDFYIILAIVVFCKSLYVRYVFYAISDPIFMIHKILCVNVQPLQLIIF